ncbi:iron-regulated protein [Archangium sp. Cb G35]|nr:iron-regulated protein [Archangium sp. Cb G35]
MTSVPPSAPSRWFRFNLWVHRWASLAATVPFLVLCLTGTVLIFHEEIDALLGVVPTSQTPTQARLAECMETLARELPDQRVLSVGLDPQNHPGVMLAVVGPPEDTGFDRARLVYLDLGTARLLGNQEPGKSFTGMVLELHANWFLGPAGELIGALIALLVLASLFSSVVIYKPFMRKVTYGAVRKNRGARVFQLDLHNFIGAIILGWALVVSVTGLALGLGKVAFGLWQYTDLATLRQDFAHEAPVDYRNPPAKVTEAIAAVEAVAKPGFHVTSVLYPGTEFTTPRHYGVLLNGSTGLDAKLLDVKVVDAQTGKIVRDMKLPPYLQALYVAEPLHFGDYGGLPLKILWSLCNLLTLFITANGAWLFFDKRRVRKLHPAMEWSEA